MAKAYEHVIEGRALGDTDWTDMVIEATPGKPVHFEVSGRRRTMRPGKGDDARSRDMARVLLGLMMDCPEVD